MSPFGYNESLAQDYFPLQKEEALQLGFNWNDRTPGTYGKGMLETKDIPEVTRGGVRPSLKRLIHPTDRSWYTASSVIRKKLYENHRDKSV